MLELKNVSAGYGSKTVIKNISLTFEPGRIYAILGKNGCGKSTLLKTCIQMLSASQGEIILNNKNILSYSPIERAQNISYLSQHRNTPNITVERLLIHGRHPHMSHLKQLRPDDLSKLEEVMERMEITAFRHHSLSTLSGGQRQRVYIAMLLAQDTPVILLDEPTTYMDIEYQMDFLKLLQQLKASGKTILLVLHDLNQALQIADQVVLLDNGQVFATASPEELVENQDLEKVFHISVTSQTLNSETFFYIRKK